MSDVNERLARMETNIEWIKDTLKKHVQTPECERCKLEPNVTNNRRHIWLIWVGIAGAYLKGFIADVYSKIP